MGTMMVGVVPPSRHFSRHFFAEVVAHDECMQVAEFITQPTGGSVVQSMIGRLAGARVAECHCAPVRPVVYKSACAPGRLDGLSISPSIGRQSHQCCIGSPYIESL